MSCNSNNKSPQIGDIYIMEFNGTNNLQSGIRPGVVFQNNLGNIHSPNIIALPLTSVMKKIKQPTHVLLRANEVGLKLDSIVLCENPVGLSKQSLGQFITRLSDKHMREIAVAHLLSSSAISYLDLDSLVSVWEKANSLNDSNLVS